MVKRKTKRKPAKKKAKGLTPQQKKMKAMTKKAQGIYKKNKSKGMSWKQALRKAWRK